MSGPGGFGGRHGVAADPDAGVRRDLGGWLVVTGLVFSYMQGIIHPYYMAALAPAIGALVGVGAMSLWQARLGWAGRVTAMIAILVSAWWSYELLDRTPHWLPWLRVMVIAAGVVGAAAVLVTGLLAAGRARALSRLPRSRPDRVRCPIEPTCRMSREPRGIGARRAVHGGRRVRRRGVGRRLTGRWRTRSTR